MIVYARNIRIQKGMAFSKNKSSNILIKQDKDIEYVFLLIIFSLAIFAISFLIQSTFGVEYTSYTSQASAISFKYPDTWKVNETISFDGSRMTIFGPSILEDGAFLLSSNIIPARELNSILLDPKSKFSYLYFNYKTMDSILSSVGDIVEEPFSLMIGLYKGESMIYKQDILDQTQQDWFVSTPNERSYMMSFVAPSNKFDSPDSKDIRTTFISSINFLKPN